MCSVREKLRIVGRAAAFVLLAAAGFAARSATPPAEACAAATNGLPKFLGKIPSGAEAAYGFPEGTRRAALGRPVQLEAFEPTSLEQISRSGALEDKVRRYQTWFFPVLVGSETRAFLVVDRRSSADWEAVSLGYAPVAREWNEVVRAWPAERGFHPRLIAAFQARGYFFNVPQVGDRNLTPLREPGAKMEDRSRDYRLLGAAAEHARWLLGKLPQPGR